MSTRKITKEDMLKDYLSFQLMYVDFTNYVENKIKNLLIENNIKYQSISSRVKSYDSLDKKLTEQMIDGISRNIKNLNDLSGVRVIFYDEAELNKFASLISSCFKIEKYKPSDDIMKYDGTNITISLNKIINKFNGMKCEIQLTTLMSHAINEFGHDIIYKGADELKSKDIDEYNVIEEIFKEVRNNVLNIYASLEVINRRVQSIKDGAKNVELILSDEVINNLNNSKSFSDVETIMQKMVDIIPLVNKDPDKYKQINNLGIISKIVNKFSELPHEDAIFLSYDNYEYKYTKLLEFLQSYKYLWIDDFNYVIVKLYDISKANNIVNRFDKFVENLLNTDKAESVKGYAYYNIHEKVFPLISNDNIDNHIRLKLAECYCDLRFNYCKEVGMDKVSFVNGKLKISDEYKQRIYQVISIMLNMLLTNYSEEVLKAIININYCLESDPEVFKVNPVYSFFYKHYDKINIYSKNKLYDSLCIRKKSQFKESSLYKKIKEDNVQMIFAFLFNHHIEDPIDGKYEEKEEYRINYLSNFITDFNDDNVNDVLLLLKNLNMADSNSINIHLGGKYLFKIGYETKYGKKLLSKLWNEYVFIGVIKRDKKYFSDIKNSDIAIKVIKAMNMIDETDEKLLEALISLAKKLDNEEMEFELLRLIVNNPSLNCTDKYKKYFLDKVKLYNKLSKGIIGSLLLNYKSQESIIDKYKKSEINILLNNYKYCDFNQFDDLFLNDLFMKYPDSLRKIFKWKAINYPQRDLFNSYNFCNLSNCTNFDKELSNNLSLCVEIMKNKNHYYKSNYIRYLLGDFNENLEKVIINYLKQSVDVNDYSAIVRICRIFDVSLSCWNIYEAIISKLEFDDKLLDEIDCNLFSGVFSGEDGLANSFYEKYNFFKGLKSKDARVMRFAKREVENYNILYHDEKNKQDKNKITKETKYKLENKK